jgi:hypothetical protein
LAQVNTDWMLEQFLALLLMGGSKKNKSKAFLYHKLGKPV